MVSVLPEIKFEGCRRFYNFVQRIFVIILFDANLHITVSRINTDKSVIYG